jgi:hypothetical protein
MTQQFIRDPKTMDVAFTRVGKLSGELHLAVQADGKSHTVTRRSLNKDSKWVEEVMVFDRQ